MTRFSNHAEVKQAAEVFAADVYKHHTEKGHDLNPYATEGARSEFQRALDNGPFYSFERQDEHSRGYDFRYQAGRAMAKIIATIKEKNQ